MTSRPRSSERLTRLLVLAAVIALAASVTQCRMVTDHLVRPVAQDFDAGSCVKACAKAAAEAREEENELHKDRIEACRGDEDDGSDDLRGNGTYRRDKPDGKKDKRDKGDKDKKKNECLAAEEARHKAALKAIDAQRMECMNGCHHQGGGTGR